MRGRSVRGGRGPHKGGDKGEVADGGGRFERGGLMGEGNREELAKRSELTTRASARTNLVHLDLLSEFSSLLLGGSEHMQASENNYGPNDSSLPGRGARSTDRDSDRRRGVEKKDCGERGLLIVEITNLLGHRRVEV